MLLVELKFVCECQKKGRIDRLCALVGLAPRKNWMGQSLVPYFGAWLSSTS